MKPESLAHAMDLAISIKDNQQFEGVIRSGVGTYRSNTLGFSGSNRNSGSMPTGSSVSTARTTNPSTVRSGSDSRPGQFKRLIASEFSGKLEPSSKCDLMNETPCFSHSSTFQEITTTNNCYLLASKSPYSLPAYVRQQGLAESIFRDMRVGFGKWEFDPMEIENPFPNNKGSVHLWHGEDDRLVPVLLQRYIAKKLPWIHYHELPGVGHLLPNYDGKKEAILKSLLLRE
ncbi:alpha/beta-Hydrolases superfamily protein [Artemisia annua]|uniref:Alpha/beta-Hydrolases superfamily protein n=1 Tax=Artemisia annua TaxID=35608 RepID=A0A2U1MAW9_ARTAN|nr:alpha/beta-Hydrolases superfamily protein [Artemisia annua]